ncbi:family 43 glycosylhydrolase [Mucilaginibacter mali]|uniref:Family 43 glycosylhydrolase n=2 Tax=Mucilaginibacter mali TaxID=2740462 RepID=A0A7D4Q4J8_9SPHI|nr:family 43 glycosylhydrolase [Mucilaginibacter mali]
MAVPNRTSLKQLSLAGIITLAILLWYYNGYAQQLQRSIPVHDPVMIKQDSTYFLFCTGRGIAVWSSTNMVDWKREPQVFETAPEWITGIVPGFKNSYWAPDISYYNGLYYLYYAVSAFGKNTSAIGLVTNKTLYTKSPDFKWVDHGEIIRSVPGKTNWNAIDPNLAIDGKGVPYLFFGSFWDGLKIARLNKDRMSVADDINKLPTVASRKKNGSSGTNPPSVDDNPVDAGGNAIEAPFVFSKGKYFYLFASIDYCCKGPKSTYKMIVGRAKNIKGPYLDKDGVNMATGGGTIVLAGDNNWYGVGHNAVCTFDGIDYLIFHGYDAADKGISKLRVEKLTWDNDWPVVLK